MLLILRGGIPATVLWLPVLLIPQLLFTLGLCWFLAATGAYLRDLGQIIGFVLTLWFFITPICYPDTKLAASGAVYSGQESDLYPGAWIPRHPVGASCSRVAAASLNCGCCRSCVSVRACLVLPATESFRGRDLGGLRSSDAGGSKSGPGGGAVGADVGQRDYFSQCGRKGGGSDFSDVRAVLLQFRSRLGRLACPSRVGPARGALGRGNGRARLSPVPGNSPC